jgi:hypothetical protein
VLFTGCSSSGIDNKDAVREAMVEYLQAHSTETGLDPSAMEVNVDAVAFDRDVARATVSFRVKGGGAGMQMNYTLDRAGDKWVTRKPPSKGAPHPAVEQEQTLPPVPGTGPMPGGLPGVDPNAPLPSGHPTVPGQTK